MNQGRSHAQRQAHLQATTLAIAERRQSKGFARGTLIHTAGGLVPIELLRPGYRVLSRAPEADARAEPHVVRPIAAVQVHQRTPVLRVEYERPGEPGRFSQVTVAPGQPLWTLDKGWVWAGEASGGWLGPSKLLTVSGSAVDCDGKAGVHAPGRVAPRRVWLDDLDLGCAMLDLHLNQLADRGWLHGGDAGHGERRHRYGVQHDPCTTTYSIEVEGPHTFFAGLHGLLMGDSVLAGWMAGGPGRRSGLA